MTSEASSSTLAVTLPGHSLNRQKVLEEEEYTAALSHIIARDFFPSLAEATNDFSDESRSDGSYPVNSSIRRLPDIDSTPALGSNIGETPIFVRGRIPSKRARYDTNLSLDDFQARYTSEDNSSFTQILDEENRKRKERWAWAWDAQRRVEGQRMIAQDVRKKMLIEAPGATGVREKFAIEASGPVGLLMPAEDVAQDEEGSGNAGQVAILETTTTEVDVLAPKKDTRSTRVDGWDFKTRNSLMFPPDADISPYGAANMASIPKDPKSVEHRNTQIPEQDTLYRPPSPTPSRIDAALSKNQSSDNFTLIPSPPPSERRMTREDSELPPPSTPFHIPALSSREAISQKLSNNASKSLRAKAELLGLKSLGRLAGITPSAGGRKRRSTMAPPTSGPQRADAGSLTPAARSLLDRTTLGASAARKARASQSDLDRMRWTPLQSPSIKRGS